MPYDRKKTDGFDTKRNIKNRSERSDTQRIRKSPNEKPFAGKRQTERKTTDSLNTIRMIIMFCRIRLKTEMNIS